MSKLEPYINYKVNKSFNLDKGFIVTAKNVCNASVLTDKIIAELPKSLFLSIDYKTVSAVVGSIFCQSLANEVDGAMVNPIEKGHPDIIPKSGAEASEESLRNYPQGLEIKCTIGNIKTGSNLRAGKNRLDVLTGITWQAHHREVKELLGIVWDFENQHDDFSYPTITGVFFSSLLNIDDWGAISGTTGRNTKVCGMNSSGRLKMAEGWILIHNKYQEKYFKLLGIKKS
jgi:hypothetical protein